MPSFAYSYGFSDPVKVETETVRQQAPQVIGCSPAHPCHQVVAGRCHFLLPGLRRVKNLKGARCAGQPGGVVSIEGDPADHPQVITGSVRLAHFIGLH